MNVHQHSTMFTKKARNLSISFIIILDLSNLHNLCHVMQSYAIHVVLAVLLVCYVPSCFFVNVFWTCVHAH